MHFLLETFLIFSPIHKDEETLIRLGGQTIFGVYKTNTNLLEICIKLLLFLSYEDNTMNDNIYDSVVKPLHTHTS